ncbi:MAG: DUF4339 domain-containing protein [Chlamydiota bacterium]
MAQNLKVWYILIENQEEGPYSLQDLKKDRRLTPFVLVRKSGSKRWYPIGRVKALKAVFKDEGVFESKNGKKAPLLADGPEALLLNPSDPDSPITLIVFIILLLVVWLIYNSIF